jgi:hypothetical protein
MTGAGAPNAAESPYSRLARLAERRAELASAGAWEDAASIAAELERLQAPLPQTPPREAKPELEEALLHTRRAEAAIQAALDATRADLGALGRGRRLSAAYTRA